MAGQIVSFRCTLKDRFGQIISQTENYNVSTELVLEDGSSAPMLALVKRMQNLRSGEVREIHLQAADAFGFYDPQKTLELTLEDIENPDQVRLGAIVEVSSNRYRVKEVLANKVVLDANHPLAGQDVTFVIEALQVAEIAKTAPKSNNLKYH